MFVQNVIILRKLRPLIQLLTAFLPLSGFLSSPQLKELMELLIQKLKLKLFHFLFVGSSPCARAEPVVVPARDCRRQRHLLTAALARFQHLEVKSQGIDRGVCLQSFQSLSI